MQEETYKVKLTLEDQFIVEPEVEQTLVRILMLKGEKGDKGDAGEGDMNKSVYDTNDDGKVNAADTADTATNATNAENANNANTVNNHNVNDDVPADFFSGDATTTAEGTDITLTDALTLKSVDLKGDTFQQTYSGKNLYDATKAEARSSGLTYSADTGQIYLNGNRTGARIDFNSMTLPAGTYKFMVELVSGSISTTSTGALFYFAGSGVSTSPAQVYLSDANKRANMTVTISSTTECVVYIYPRISETFTNAVVKYQLVAGSDVDWNFEPYVGGTASPNPSFSQPIQVVTGEQTVTVSDGDTSQSYTIDLGSIELAKIGTYQDYIYKSGDDWYVHKTINKAIYNGTESSWVKGSSGSAQNVYIVEQGDMIEPMDGGKTKCDHFTYNASAYDPNVIGYFGSKKSNNVMAFRFGIGTSADFDTLEEWKTWLSSHNVTVYYALATPTDTKITDSTLIGELNALWHAYMYDGTISLTSSGSLPAILSVEAFNKNANGIAGAIKTINSGL